MKVLGISGSPRRGGNTEILIRTALSGLETEGVETEFLSLADRQILPCTACGDCENLDPPQCTLGDPHFEGMIEAFMEADGVLVGSPVYFGSATPAMLALLDRAGYVSRANDHMLSRKIGGPVVVARRAGQNFTYAQLMMWYMLNDMVVVGSTYWNIAFGMKRGEVVNDTEGIETIERFAENLAWFCRLTTAD